VRLRFGNQLFHANLTLMSVGYAEQFSDLLVGGHRTNYELELE
jgi:hypothetical protein